MMEIMGGWWDPCSICPSRIFNRDIKAIPRFWGSLVNSSQRFWHELFRLGPCSSLQSVNLPGDFPSFPTSFPSFSSKMFGQLGGSRSELRRAAGHHSFCTWARWKNRQQVTHKIVNMMTYDARLLRLVHPLLVKCNKMQNPWQNPLDWDWRANMPRRKRVAARGDEGEHGLTWQSLVFFSHPNGMMITSDQYFSEVITCSITYIITRSHIGYQIAAFPIFAHQKTTTASCLASHSADRFPGMWSSEWVHPAHWHRLLLDDPEPDWGEESDWMPYQW